MLPDVGIEPREGYAEGSRDATSADLDADAGDPGGARSYLGSELAEPERDDVPNLDRVERLRTECTTTSRTRQPTAHRLLRRRGINATAT